MKKLIKPIFVLMLFVASSCVDDLTSLNVNPKAYQSGTVPAAPFFTNATKSLVDNVVNGFTFKVLAQQFAETTYFDASSYNLVNVGNGFWVNMYNLLIDLKEAKKIIADDPSLFPGVDKNRLAMIEVLEVYVFANMVNTYGDIPYSGALNASLKSEALDSDEITPAYDDAAAIYDDLFARLDKAIADLDPNADSGGGDLGFGSADLIYGDDISGWIKFATSLKLRMAITLADVNFTKAKSIVESISAANLIQSNDENALLHYLETTPNTNPIWVDLIQSEREDYVASNTMIDLMKAPTVDDPRIPLYYTEDNAGGYSGGIYGRSNSYVTYSKAGAAMTETTSPGVLMDYAEVEFLLAEAAARGINVTGSAALHYTNGIKASIEYWGGDAADADAYVADPAVAFATAIGGSDLNKIARQKYLALFNRGLEAWTEYRRLDFPTFNAPPVPNGDFPIRYTYPNSEQTSNGENWSAADAAIGGDELTTKVFWDTK
jgi:hypothetical protein